MIREGVGAENILQIKKCSPRREKSSSKKDIEVVTKTIRRKDISSEEEEDRSLNFPSSFSIGITPS